LHHEGLAEHAIVFERLLKMAQVAVDDALHVRIGNGHVGAFVLPNLR
jgi:hypothetical protein